ncbi:hypothetical protein [Brachybacterium hainanense]|uniref:Uncharacterized protein n=1 Tax=Brachybacterium hainanense TaxID=1541174 RepID=A0ABV6R950_9MICO
MPETRSIRTMKRHEVTAQLLADDPTMLPSYAHYLAGKMKRLVQRRDLGWYAALRILGMTADPTAAEAVMPRTEPTRHVSGRRPLESLGLVRAEAAA